MKKLTLNFPDTFDMDEKEIVNALAAQLYDIGKLSLGQAADLAGLSKRKFMESLANFGVSVFNYPVEDLARDIAHAKNHHS